MSIENQINAGNKDEQILIFVELDLLLEEAIAVGDRYRVGVLNDIVKDTEHWGL